MLVQHRGFLPVLLFLCSLNQKFSCWLPSEKLAPSSFSKIMMTPQLPSNIDPPLVTRKFRRANRNYITSIFKIQQIPHQGGELVSVSLVLLFICLRTTPAASREEFHSHVGVWCQVSLTRSKTHQHFLAISILKCQREAYSIPHSKQQDLSYRKGII